MNRLRTISRTAEVRWQFVVAASVVAAAAWWLVDHWNGAGVESADTNGDVPHASVHSLPSSQKTTDQTGQAADIHRLLTDAGFADMQGKEPAPLTMSCADEKSIKLADLHGKLVLLHFWATTCLPCIQEIPAIEKLQAAYPGQLAIVHVCVDADDATSATEIIQQTSATSVSSTPAHAIELAAYDVQILPTVWLIAPDGKVIGRASGARDWHSTAFAALLKNVLPPLVE